MKIIRSIIIALAIFVSVAFILSISHFKYFGLNKFVIVQKDQEIKTEQIDMQQNKKPKLYFIQSQTLDQVE